MISISTLRSIAIVRTTPAIWSRAIRGCQNIFKDESRHLHSYNLSKNDRLRLSISLGKYAWAGSSRRSISSKNIGFSSLDDIPSLNDDFMTTKRASVHETDDIDELRLYVPHIAYGTVTVDEAYGSFKDVVLPSGDFDLAIEILRKIEITPDNREKFVRLISLLLSSLPEYSYQEIVFQVLEVIHERLTQGLVLPVEAIDFMLRIVLKLYSELSHSNSSNYLNEFKFKDSFGEETAIFDGAGLQKTSTSSSDTDDSFTPRYPHQVNLLENLSQLKGYLQPRLVSLIVDIMAHSNVVPPTSIYESSKSIEPIITSDIMDIDFLYYTRND